MTTRRQTYGERRARADARRAERAEVEDPAVVLEAAAAFLAVRPRSVDETRRRLRHLGYPVGPIEVAWTGSSPSATWTTRRSHAPGSRAETARDPRSETVLRRELRAKGHRCHGRRCRAVRPRPRRCTWSVGRRDPGPRSRGAGRPRGRGRRAAAAGTASGSARPRAGPPRRRQKAYALLARNGFAPDVCARVAAESIAHPIADEGEDEPAEAAADGV